MRYGILIAVLLLASCAAFERAGERLAAGKGEIVERGIDAAKDVLENPTLANAAAELAEYLAYIASIAIGIGAPALVVRNKRSNERKAKIEERVEALESKAAS